MKKYLYSLSMWIMLTSVSFVRAQKSDSANERKILDSLRYMLYPGLGIGLISDVLVNYGVGGGKNQQTLSLFNALAPSTMSEWLKKIK